MISDKGEYFALNVTAKVGLLDVANSKITWGDPGKRVFYDVIESCVVDEPKLENNPISCIPQFIGGIYINRDFVHRVESSDLKEFYAKQVYPDPDGDFQLNSDMSNSVVLRFGFGPEVQKSSAINSLKRLSRQLDQLLANDSSELIGSFEESEFLDSEGRSYLSTPDRIVLGKLVESWVKKIAIQRRG